MANKVHRSINVGEHNPTPPIGINMFETIIFNGMRRKKTKTKNKQNSFPTSYFECIQIAKSFFLRGWCDRVVDK